MGVTRLLALLALCGAGSAWAGKAHEHGVARLDVAASSGRLELTLDIPLADLTGFERAPRNDVERKAVADVATKLRAGTELFRIDPAAGCKSAAVELESAVWGLNAAANAPEPSANPAPAAARPVQPAAKPTPVPASPRPAAAKGEAHADLEARYTFECQAGAVPSHVEVTLFQSLPRLTRIEVQAVTPRGQAKAQLRRPQTRLQLAR